MSTSRISILLIAFLTGISALTYQIACARQATSLFGLSPTDNVWVLALLLGGLGIGSFVLGRRVDSHPNSLKLFALLHFGIGIFSLISPFLLAGLAARYGSLSQSLPLDSTTLTAVRILFAALTLVPPAFLVGVAFPIAARSFAQHDGRIGSQVGQFYTVALLGAALGCGLTGLVLGSMLEARQTIFIAAGLNFLTGIIGWVIANQAGRGKSKRSRSQRKNTRNTNIEANQSGLVSGFVIWAYALSGLVALGYMMVWSSIIDIYTLDAVYSLSATITAFLAGMTVGGGIASWRLARRQRNGQSTELGQFVDIQMWLGLSALGTLYAFSLLSNATDYKLMLGCLTLLVPSIFLGMLVPVVISLATHEKQDESGRIVGRVKGLYTISAALGALLVGFGLIPLVELQASGAILACISLITGFVASWISRVQGEESSWLPHVGIALGIALIMLLPEGIY